MALGLSPKGLWSMDYDSPGFVQLSSFRIRRPNLAWILPPSSWVKSNQFLGEGPWSSPPPKIVLCTCLIVVEDGQYTGGGVSSLQADQSNTICVNVTTGSEVCEFTALLDLSSFRTHLSYSVL